MSQSPWIMTPEVKEIVRAKYATCLDLGELAKEVGASVHTVRAYAKKIGLSRPRGCPPGYHKITPEQAKQILAAYTRGLSCRDLRKHFGLSHQGILNVVRQEGGTVRAHKRDAAHVASVLAEVCGA